MLGIPRLYCDRSTPGDALRYERKGWERRLVVVWNCTRRCNLKCVYCNPESGSAGELTASEARGYLHQWDTDNGAPVLMPRQPRLRDQDVNTEPAVTSVFPLFRD